jgi:hypothetical protein
MKLNPFLSLYTKTIKNLNIKPENIKLLHEKNKGNTLRHLCRQFFLREDPKGTGSKSKNERYFITKKILHSKGNTNRVKRHPTDWKKILANYSTNKGLASKIYKELKTAEQNNN